jgi:catechol 2,3-dioxygenase-like lactoylglutathione lyase family enzyme
MGIVGIHHIQLAMPAGQEQAAADFYSEVLGIPQVEKPAHLAARGGCWFEQGEIRIHLGVEEDFRPAGKAHPALLVPDLAEIRARLEEAGVTTIVDQPLPGYDRFYAPDPFGNRLEFLAIKRTR